MAYHKDWYISGETQKVAMETLRHKNIETLRHKKHWKVFRGYKNRKLFKRKNVKICEKL